MTAQQQPGPSFEGPVYPPAPQQWQGSPGLPPYNQAPQKQGGPKPLIILVSALLAAALFMGAGMLIGRELAPKAEPQPTVTVTVEAAPGEQPAQGSEVAPPNATEGYGILISGKAPSADKPHLIIWEDPQCPACAMYETHFGPVIAQLVADGAITAEARFAYFLDRGQPDGASLRGAIAMAAADAVGRFDQYHTVLFQQLAGVVHGYSDANLVEFAAMAGIQGADLATFEQLYQDRVYQGFVANSFTKFTEEQIAATPTFLVSGKRLRFYDEATSTELISPNPDSFLAAVQAAWEAGGRQIEAPPEPR